MEEEKLLFSLKSDQINKKIKKTYKMVIVLAILLSNQAYSSSNLDSSEFDKLLNHKVNQKLFVSDEKINFYMFASLGLSDVLLRQMLDYAKIYNGVIVLRGIKNNSFRQTADHIQRLSREGEEAAIIIDPTLFKQFQISQVPSYVLAKEQKCPVGSSCKPSYDKITGNITPKYALEKFVEKGDLFQEAQKLLGVNG